MSFTIGALMYYYIFYQSKLIPRWLSGWGFIAAAISLFFAVSTMFGTIFGQEPFSTILNIPIALQEMALAVWLIVKGFNLSAVNSD